MKILVLSLISFVTTAMANGQWAKRNVDTTASLRGLAVVNEKVVWASGTGGTVIRTIDGDKTWKVMTVPGAEKLDFRDVEAFDANTAYILSIGNGESSRIYKTLDGGTTWKERFRNRNEKAFFDAIACWDKNNCIAMSDPVDKKFVLIETKNGGTNWTAIDTTKMPEAKDGEAAFAASGTCLITQGKNNAFLVTGGNDARVFKSTDRGLTWKAYGTPVVKGTPGSGIFSIAMRDALNGVIVGGNYEKPQQIGNYLARSRDGGKTWKSEKGLTGYRSGVAYVDAKTLAAVGTNGTDVFVDEGRSWRKISELNLNSVQGKGKAFTWGVGPNGQVVRQSQGEKKRKTRSSAAIPVCDPPPGVNAMELERKEIAACPGAGSCSATISVTVHATECGEIRYVYTVSGGKIVGEGPNVTWDLAGVSPGSYTITAGIEIGKPPLRGVWGKTWTERVHVVP